MQHEQGRYPVTMTLKVSRELATELRRVARKDDRTLSGYVRRLLASAVKQQPTAAESPAADVADPEEQAV